MAVLLGTRGDRKSVDTGCLGHVGKVGRAQLYMGRVLVAVGRRDCPNKRMLNDVCLDYNV